MGEALLPRQEVRISWEAHEPDLRLEDTSKRVKKAEEKQVAPAIVTWREGGFVRRDKAQFKHITLLALPILSVWN